MSGQNNEHDENYDGEYNGKPIVYAEGLHDLFKQKADLTEADKKLLAGHDLPLDLDGAKTALDEIAEVPLNLAKMGARIWNLWVKLNKWRWLIPEESGPDTKVRFANFRDGSYKALKIDFGTGQVRSDEGYYEIEGLNFQGFVFPWVVFERARFGNWVSFHGARFGGEVIFDEARFAGGAYFHEARFGAETSFDGASFGNWVSFHEANFGNWVSFHGTVFLADAQLNDAHFKRNVDLSKVYFLQAIDLENARIEGYADFDYAWFGKTDRTPLPARYEGNAEVKKWDDDLRRAYDSIPIVNAESLNVPNFKGTEFKLPPNLGYTNIPLPPLPNIPKPAKDGEVQNGWKHFKRFIGVNQDYIKIKDKDAASKFRRLQELAALGHNHHAEAKFFRAELLARRGHEVTSKLRITAINCYELFSKCGLSFWKPIGWWAIVFTLFALLAYLPFTRVPVFDDTANIGHLFNYTLSNALPFIGVFRGNDTVAVDALYGGAAGIPFWNSFCAGFHNLISSILLFLALLAVRNYFKMR